MMQIKGTCGSGAVLVKYGVQCAVVQCSVAKIPCNYKGGTCSVWLVIF